MNIMLSLIPLNPNASQIISFSIAGFCVVMVVLWTMSSITAVVGKFFVFAEKLAAQEAARKAAASGAATGAKSPFPADIPPEHAFVISAAVASVMPELQKDASGELLAVLSAAATVALDGDECRVVSYKPIDANYARFGREQIFNSRNYTPAKK